MIAMLRHGRFIRLARRAALCALVAMIALPAAERIAGWVFPFPLDRLEGLPRSPRVLDRSGAPLLSLVGQDDQWRLPVPIEEISPWLIEATVAVEDARFHDHGGVDVMAVARAAYQNVVARRIVSGASTITMQVCRMLDDRPRTFTAKFIEAFRARQLERMLDKREILEAYLNMAPYGGNIRGCEAAARAYFQKSAAYLTMGEAALLAGIPQSPARLRPDAHARAAHDRRATVLRRMVETGRIKREEAEALRPLRVERRPLNRMSRTVVATVMPMTAGRGYVRTTIDPLIQTVVEELLDRHAPRLPEHARTSVAVIDVEKAEYVALAEHAATKDRYRFVSAARAARSPGSALKPFIYAAAIEDDLITPETLVEDAPISRRGWRPRNFQRQYHGLLPAADALRRSLNVPAILVTERLGVPRAARFIRACGIPLPVDTERRAGLSICVGGAEVSLLDLTNAYATLARDGQYVPARLDIAQPPQPGRRAMSAATAQTISAMLAAPPRLPESIDHMAAGAIAPFMWKTGTSSARRDAWAIGHNRRFAVGVWVGRVAGAGDYRFVGAQAAEPILVDLFQHPALRQSAPLPLPAIDRPTLPAIRCDGDTTAILEPRDGATYVAWQRKAAVPIEASPDREGGDDNPTHWFLNGRLLNDELLNGRTCGVVNLSPGSYRLTCVRRNGAVNLSDSVEFEVVARTTPGPADRERSASGSRSAGARRFNALR